MQIYGVKMRQVHVLRLKKEFAPAEALMVEVLKESPNSLKVQTEAAELYQDWGNSGQADSAKKLILAIQGTTKTGGNIWGWGQIAFKLQKSADFASNPVYIENFLNARYNGTSCRLKFSREQATKDKQKHLEGCRTEIMATAGVTKDMPDEQYQKFNALYREVLVDMGKPAEDLPKAHDVPVTPPEKPVASEVKSDGTPGKNPNEPAPPEPPKGIDTMTWAVLSASILLGIGAIVWGLIKVKSKHMAKSFGTATAKGPVSFSGITVGDALPPATFVAPKPKPRPAATSGGATAGASAGTRPATKPTAKPAAPGAAGTAAPKPKPKPPSPPSAK